jgi:hypothetical protein
MNRRAMVLLSNALRVTCITFWWTGNIETCQSKNLFYALSVITLNAEMGPRQLRIVIRYGSMGRVQQGPARSMYLVRGLIQPHDRIVACY